MSNQLVIDARTMEIGEVRGIGNGLDRGRDVGNGLDRGRVDVVDNDRATRMQTDNRNRTQYWVF